MTDKKPFKSGEKVVCIKKDPWRYFESGKPIEAGKDFPSYGCEYIVESIEHPIDESGNACIDMWAITLFEFPHTPNSEDPYKNNIFNARHFIRA